jgi:hypothetical protein
MSHPFKQLSLALAGLVTMTPILAAQPAPAANAIRMPGTATPTTATAIPGQFTGITAAASLEINTSLTIHFAGIGHCKITLDGGDGQSSNVEGDLPFTAERYYSSASMSSFDAFKKYTAKATPTGNCKTNGPASFTLAVQVMNTHPQSAGAPPKDNTLSVAGNGKIKGAATPGKPDTVPTVAATITAIALSDKTITGAPSTAPGLAAPAALAAGSPTLLTVQGTGSCKYHLSYVNLDAQGNMIVKQYPMVPKTSSVQSPFPMSLLMLNATPAGIYKWTAAGVDGCIGNQHVTFTVQ